MSGSKGPKTGTLRAARKSSAAFFCSSVYRSGGMFGNRSWASAALATKRVVTTTQCGFMGLPNRLNGERSAFRSATLASGGQFLRQRGGQREGRRPSHGRLNDGERDTNALSRGNQWPPHLFAARKPVSLNSHSRQRIYAITTMLDSSIKPSSIVSFLDQYVIGQEDAKKTVAVAVYSHFKKIARSQRDNTRIDKSNVLLIGSSGTGKTLLCETLSRVLKVPFVTAEATSLAQTRYVNEEIEAVLRRLVDKADGDLRMAQDGIVYIDEIDKLKAGNGERHSSSGESVQHALLKIMEGAPVRLGNAQYLDTTNVLFICGGAFVGLDEIMAQTHGYGFIAMSKDDNQKILDRLNSRVKPTDLFTYGLIPEF